MTKLGAALVQVLDRKTSEEKIQECARKYLTTNPDAGEFFEDCYRLASRFMFTPTFVEQRSVTWLGGVQVSFQGDAEYARSDFFKVKDDFHDAVEIHHHLTFGGELDLTRWDTEAWQSSINTLHELYWSWNATMDERVDPSELGERLDPFLRELEPADPRTFTRRGFYISLYDAGPALISGWRTVAPALYSLLYLHSEGFDSASAAQTLEARMAQSTVFVVSFFNADALLSLSCTYPGPGVVQPLPDRYPTRSSSIGQAHAAFQQRLHAHRERFEPYDLLPEYPLLRYLDLCLIEFATTAKAKQWHIRRKLDRLTGSPIGFLSAMTALPGIDRSYYRATDLSVLRLAVARDLAEKLIAEQAVGSNEQAIDGMKTSLLNTLVAVLTVAAVVIGIVQVVLAFS